MVATFAFILGLAPSLAWLVFYLHEDYRHHRITRLIAITFVLGGFSTFLVLPIQLFLNNRLASLNISAYGFPYFLLLGGIEEVVKFLVVYLFIRNSKEFSLEPLHAMIYMVVVALGFAAAENIASVFQAGREAILQSKVFETITLRFIGATLLHTLASGLVGYFWGRMIAEKYRYSLVFRLLIAQRHYPRIFFSEEISRGLLIATILHATFNYLIIKDGPTGLAILFLMFVAFFILNDFEKLKQPT